MQRVGMGSLQQFKRARNAGPVFEECPGAHGKPITAVEWHPTDRNCYFSAAEDGKVISWDFRTGEMTRTLANAHGDNFGVNCFAYNPASDGHEFLTGAGGGRVQDQVPEAAEIKLWDDRAWGKGPVHTFTSPSTFVFDKEMGAQVYQVKWSPHDKNEFGSCSGDGAVRIWNKVKVGSENRTKKGPSSSGQHDEAPAELKFIHGGHTDLVSDFQFDPQDRNAFCSVADDNICMFWRTIVQF